MSQPRWILRTTALIAFLFGSLAAHADTNINYEQCETNAFDKNAAKQNAGPLLDDYNWLAHDITTAAIKDGFIISFEKLRNQDNREADTALYRQHLTEYTDQNSDYPAIQSYRNALLTKLGTDPKWPSITYIANYHNYTKSYLYNPYKDHNTALHTDAAQIHRSFSNGLSELTQTFQTALKSRITSGNFTHIFFMSMGWNNDQGVSLCRFDALFQVTQAEMQKQGKAFRPLLIGITWPSVWLNGHGSKTLKAAGHLGSVFNKANDADEIGVFGANILLNQIIPRANTKNLPVVAIGHSYGARIVSRAIYSRQLLKDGAENGGPEVALLLQPAYSAQRHMIGKGLEGYPYAPIKDLKTKVYVTSSKGDTANPIAVWSRHIGGILGLKKAQRNPEIFRYIDQNNNLGKTLSAIPGARANIPTVINATKFITNHGDIYNPAVGKLLATILATQTQ